MNQPLRVALAIIGIVAIALGGTLYVLKRQSAENENIARRPSKAQRIEDAIKDNFERTKDPKLGYPPVDRLAKAIEQTRQMQQKLCASKK
ncbi:MAG: hypothetical protein HC892_07365 [Saprospiraceae bacterium]|nr:hypothetical protein [Saprospiraceae bacterium]